MKAWLKVLGVGVCASVLVGCGGGGDDNGGTGGGGGGGTQSNPSADVSAQVAQQVLSSAMSGMQNAGRAHLRGLPDKATFNTQVTGPNSVRVTVTFNDPIPVNGGSATLTGTLVMNEAIGGSTVTADVDIDVAANFSQAGIIANGRTHTVNGRYAISGPMDMNMTASSSSATMTASWNWTIRSTNLTIDGVSYSVNLTFSGNIAYPGSVHATLTGTINGQAVSQNISVTM